jgi:hypothetical protein
MRSFGSVPPDLVFLALLAMLPAGSFAAGGSRSSSRSIQSG